LIWILLCKKLLLWCLPLILWWLWSLSLCLLAGSAACQYGYGGTLDCDGRSVGLKAEVRVGVWTGWRQLRPISWYRVVTVVG
jgi:hypothetical protein